MATLAFPATAPADVLTEKPRIAAIDIMRGIVMVVMALDHARDFYHADAFVYDPLDLERTTPLLFFTRFITHFCAPTFVLLAGTAVRISEQRKSKREISWFLFTRGLWLVLLEVTIVRFGIFGNLYYDVLIFQVIWAIGFSMMLLSAAVHLPFKAIVILGLVITAGHDLLHVITLSPDSPNAVLWSFIHQSGFRELAPGVSAMIPYPFLPWFGILLLGYSLGVWYSKGFDSEKRKKLLLRTGIFAIILFILLRAFNIYGDPAPWSEQRNAVFTFLSFLNVTKYPASLQYALVTLGPVLILLSVLENARAPFLRPFGIIGRVPLFYYILHFYLLHLGAIVLLMIRSGKSLSEIDFHFSAGMGGIPFGEGYPLIGAYIAWISVVLFLYPFCVWYDRYKSGHKRWWLSYL